MFITVFTTARHRPLPRHNQSTPTHPLSFIRSMLGAFALLRTAPLSFHLYQRWSHRMDLREIWYWRLLLRSVEEILIWLKSDKNIKICGGNPNLVKIGQKYLAVCMKTFCCCGRATGTWQRAIFCGTVHISVDTDMNLNNTQLRYTIAACRLSQPASCSTLQAHKPPSASVPPLHSLTPTSFNVGQFV
jgi:hypothetical protein